MHSMQLLLKQPLHTGLNIMRPSCQRPFVSSLPPKKLSLSVQNPALRKFSACLRCQFRFQSRSFTSKHGDDWLPRPEQKFADTHKFPRETNSISAAVSDSQQDTQFHNPVSRDTLKETNKSEEDNLPSESERRRSQLSKQFTEFMDTIQSNVFIAGQKLNDLTGYSGIEKLKQDIEAQENQVLEARSIVRQAKDAYSAAISRRSASQREVNELLQRKHAWSAADLERFTSLYRSDHANEVAETETQDFLAKAEHELEEATTRLNRSILSRYHEEQIWSDKIRRMSTWGTWGLMGVNVLLFLVFQVLVEPWRRRRLVKGFEEKVKEAIETEAVANRAAVVGLTRAAEARADALAEASVTSNPVPVEQGSDSGKEDITLESASNIAVVSSGVDGAPVDIVIKEPLQETALWDQVSPIFSANYWRQTIGDMFSDRNIVLTQRELTHIAMQSATVGATIIGITVAILRLH